MRGRRQIQAHGCRNGFSTPGGSADAGVANNNQQPNIADTESESSIQPSSESVSERIHENWVLFNHVCETKTSEGSSIKPGQLK
jgi:hypothetical protein